MVERELTVADEAAMTALGGRLAAACRGGAVVYLEGDLGAGKTTLVRAWLQGLGHAGRVKSPTYTLIEPYEIDGRHAYHLDLYRLADPEELEYLGLRDYLEPGALILVEWPEKGAGMLPAADLLVTIHHLDEGRRVVLHGLSPSGDVVVSAL